MKTIIKIVLFLFLFLFVISGVFALLGTVLGLAFGLFGAVLSIAWKIVSSPVVLILIILFLAYRLNKTAPAKSPSE